MEKPETIEEYANYYLNQGFSIIPLKIEDKTPLIQWAPYQSTIITKNEFLEYINKGPVNIGVVCGNISRLIVVDIDGEPNGSLREWSYTTKTVKTDRGYHYYFRTTNPPQGFTTEIEGVHVDIKAEGGYVVAPPSIHPNGTKYQFIDMDIPIISITNLSEISIQQPSTKPITLEADPKVMPWSVLPLKTQCLFNPAKEGERAVRAHKIASTLLNTMKLPKETVWQWLTKWNKFNKPPLEEKELFHAVDTAEKHGYTYNPNKILKECGYTGEPSTDYFVGTTFKGKWLGDELLAEYTFATMRDTGEVYVYQGGVYKPIGETIIQEEAQKKLGEQAKTHHINEVIDYIKRITYVNREDFNSNLNLLNLKNGVYNLDTGNFEPHNPDYHFLYQIPVNYKSEAECRKIDQFLQQILPDKGDREAVIELFGYCFLGDYRIQKAFALIGDGRNGKSTLLNLLKTFLGARNIVSRSLHELEENRFAKADLYGKLANIYPDLSARALRSTGTFKMLTGGDTITAEKKFHHSFNFPNNAKLIFSANRLPETNDESDAFFRRWKLITFRNKFEGENADPNLLAKITTSEELSGLFNKALQGLRNLLERGAFTNDKNIEAIREQYIKESDSVKTFTQEMIEHSPENHIEKSELYNKYCEYCLSHNYPTISKDSFMKRLPREVAVEDCRPKIGGRRVYAWRGIQLRDESDEKGEDEKLDDSPSKTLDDAFD